MNCRIILFSFALMLPAAPASAVFFFHVATSGYNISLVKVAIPRIDFLPEGGVVEVRILASNLSGDSIEGELLLTLNANSLFEYVKGGDVLRNFQVDEGQFVHLSIHNITGSGYPGPGLPCENNCDLIVTHMMYDNVDGPSGLRLMHNGFKFSQPNPRNLGFVNKGSNTANQSYLLLVSGPSKDRRLIKVSASPEFDDADLIGLVRLELHGSLMLPISVLEDGSDPRVVKTIKPALGNRRLYIKDETGRIAYATWLKSGQPFHSMKEVPESNGNLLFYLADRDPKNMPLLNFIDLNAHFANDSVSGIEVLAYDGNGNQIPGEAIITPPDSAIAADKLMVFDWELRNGSKEKGVVSSFGDSLAGIVRLKLNYLGSCDIFHHSCTPTTQYLLHDSRGSVRDFSSFGLTSSSEKNNIYAFFNRGENLEQQSFLFFYNPETIPVQVLVSDLHQDLLSSVAVVNLPPNSTKLISSHMLEKGSELVGGGLLPSHKNRQLKVVPLTPSEISVMNLIRDKNGVWRNLSIQNAFAPRAKI